MMKPAPLPFVVLSRSSQDVRLCMACDQCRDLHAAGMDLTFGEIMHYAARDDERALTCDSLWACEPLLGSMSQCPSGIDVPTVIRALRQEALRRGYRPISATPDWIQ
jgi:heterodisulfide reductase subunit C